ncbi:MAG: hypothetical protein AAGJ28_02330 [Pseudomonadota bacterium]
MKLLAGHLLVAVAITLSAALPARAVTYDVNLVLDDYTAEYAGNKAWRNTSGADPVSVNGQIVTDGTLGTLSGSNITSWVLNFTSTSGSQTASSAGLIGKVHATGTFTATATGLFSDGSAWSFLEYINDPAATYVIGRLGGNANTTNIYSYFLDTDYACDASGCTETFNKGNYAGEKNVPQIGATPFATARTLSNASVSTVPLPAGLSLLLGGLGLLAGLGWHRGRRDAL